MYLRDMIKKKEAQIWNNSMTFYWNGTVLSLY